MYYLKTTISIYINLCNMHSVHVFTYMYQIPFDSTFTIKEPRVQTKTLLKLALATPPIPECLDHRRIIGAPFKDNARWINQCHLWLMIQSAAILHPL